MPRRKNNSTQAGAKRGNQHTQQPTRTQSPTPQTPSPQNPTTQNPIPQTTIPQTTTPQTPTVPIIPVPAQITAPAIAPPAKPSNLRATGSATVPGTEPATGETTAVPTGSHSVPASSQSAAPGSSQHEPLDVLHGDPDIVEVPVEESPPVQKHISQPFNISDYNFIPGFASLEQFVIPPFVSREITDGHVQYLKGLFLNKGFNPVLGTFVVTSLRLGSRDLRFEEDNMLVGACSLLDGRHRKLALDELHHEHGDEWDSVWKRAPISCVERKDKKDMDPLEYLSLSAYFNDLSSAVLKPSFLDHLFAGVQTVKVLQGVRKTAALLIPVGIITKELHERRTLGEIDERQLRRYAAVAQKLAAYEDFHKIVKVNCKSCTALGLVHFNSPELLSVKDFNLWELCVASLRSLVTSGVKGSFEAMHASFYNCVKLLFEVIETAASHKKMPLHDVMELLVPITAHSRKTVFFYVADTMSRYTLVDNQQNANATRVRNLKRKLVQLLGEDIEPPKQSSSPSPKPKAAPAASKVLGKVKQPLNSKGDASQTVHRTLRKRKVAALKRARTPTPEPKRPAKKKKVRSAQTVVSKSSVSTYLKQLAPDDLARFMRTLGVQVMSEPQTHRHSQVDRPLTTPQTLEVLPRFYDLFDDKVPGTLPELWQCPSAYTGSQRPSWLRFLTKLPSKWPRESPIAHASPWLKAMHVPHEHRAHTVLTSTSMLQKNHHAVYYRAAHSYHKTLPSEELPDTSERFPSAVTAHEKLWCSAVLEDDAALEFFGAKKEQLQVEGYCILESFLNDAQMPSSVGSFTFPRFGSPDPFFKSLESEARESFPGEEALSNPSARKVWNVMENVSSSFDSNAVIQGEGRFRMTNFGIVERLDTNSEKVWSITARASVDIRVAQCVAALKLGHGPGSKALFMPRTGGRWVLTSKKCQRQALHTDFKPLSREETLTHFLSPGYFTIATGEREVPIWVSSNSHRLAATSHVGRLRAASSASTAQILRIPPFSIFVGRGDLYYSGCGTADTIDKKQTMYYHSLFIPHGEEIPRLLHTNPHFTPRFTTNLADDNEGSDGLHDSEEEAGSDNTPRPQPSSVDRYETDDSDYESREERGDNSEDVGFEGYLSS